jgi:hypothetical protein
VEASAITGTGVTATLRAAVSRILDNLKNNVDTTLHEEPELEAPDMSARSGVTPMSAGTPKLTMKTMSAPRFDAEETVTVSPFEIDPIDAAADASIEEEDPFGDMAATEPEPDQPDDLFAPTAAEAAPAAQPELESLLASATEVVRALEQALDHARAHEAALRSKLGS